MSAPKILLFLSLFLPALSWQAFAAPDARTSEKIRLQTAMQKHIQDRLVDGAYLHMDERTGTVRKLVPDAPHPMIFSMGPYYVLCSHFRDERGKEVNVDFYIARREKDFVVFRSEVDKRAALQRLMQAGKIKRLD